MKFEAFQTKEDSNQRDEQNIYIVLSPTYSLGGIPLSPRWEGVSLIRLELFFSHAELIIDTLSAIFRFYHIRLCAWILDEVFYK